MPPVKVIDLFAGPGGLGEGFSSIRDSHGKPFFQLVASIEKDHAAHKTLKLRSFFRSFEDGAPEEYFSFLRGELGDRPEDLLYREKKFRTHVEQAEKESLNLTLGKDNEAIYSAIDDAVGSDDCILIGGPPCQAYSGVGKSRNAGKKGYRIEDDPRSRLYMEYLSVIAGFQPLVFVMENVKGMLSAKLDGVKVSDLILNDLEKPSSVSGVLPFRGRKSHDYKIVSLVRSVNKNDGESYDPKDFIVHTEDYGVPQQRHRVILIGLRQDVFERWDEKFLLQKASSRVSLQSVIDDLPVIRSGLSRRAGIKNTDNNWVNAIIKADKRCIPAVSKMGYSNVADTMFNYLKKIVPPRNGQGNNFGLRRSALNNELEIHKWLIDERLGLNVCNHQAKEHQVSDLHRYLFCSAWAETSELDTSLESSSPRSKHYPNILKPRHKNFDSGKFADRFRVLTRSSPAKTIVSHLAKDGHAFIHYDPMQCRSLTVREAARVQTFPDNYFFVGCRTEQYIQVGNAVPPYIAKQIAETIVKIIG